MNRIDQEEAFNIQQNLNYRIFLPKDYSKDKKYPLMVCLHGAGERGTDLDKACNIGIPSYITKGMMSLDCIVLAPQCENNKIWNHYVFVLKELIEKICNEYNVDEDKITMTGMSMGGYGTWEFALTFPHMLAGIAPICGGGVAWRASALKGMPIWAFHGNADNVVSIEQSIDMVNSARKNGALVKFTIFDNVQHNSWDEAYLETKVIDWLLKQDRKNK